MGEEILDLGGVWLTMAGVEVIAGSKLSILTKIFYGGRISSFRIGALLSFKHTRLY